MRTAALFLIGLSLAMASLPQAAQANPATVTVKGTVADAQMQRASGIDLSQMQVSTSDVWIVLTLKKHPNQAFKVALPLAKEAGLILEDNQFDSAKIRGLNVMLTYEQTNQFDLSSTGQSYEVTALQIVKKVPNKGVARPKVH